MAKYYHELRGVSKLRVSSGDDLTVPDAFYSLSGLLIKICCDIQVHLQNIVFVSHGAEVFEAKRILSESDSPRRRIEFLLSCPFGTEDPILGTVFEHSKTIFQDIYKLRNVLAHEKWMSSDQFSGMVLFSKLEEEARLLLEGGKIFYVNEAKAKDTHEAITRYIKKVKLVTCEDLRKAISSAELSRWIMMQISLVLNEKDPSKKQNLRDAFLVFKQTSKLFDDLSTDVDAIQVTGSKRKSISDNI
ncbi:hypothetical protein ABEB22_10795 [Thioclava sp. 'Guangxiensis']|uniref:hypothetical protein n=1 Tax=Thioclava sp. 'Guangxiensis' TaxID=3149044 RepID=UPI003878216D